jgi:enoyl-CoA hydratase/carnithine racemase
VADLEYTIADGIGTILLNRPHRKNAFTLEMIDEWARILTAALAAFREKRPGRYAGH